MRFSTRAIHVGQPPEPLTGAVNVPIFLSTTFAQASPGKSKGFVYGRTGNPTRAVLERTIAELEGGKAGLAFSSGLGALVTLVESIGSRQRIVAIDDVYGGTWRLLDHHHRKFGVDVEFVVAVDNTFATPALQRPLELGADIVLHSTTKYLGGHSDVLGGALAFRDPRLARRFAWLQNTVGAVPSPFDSFLILRGIHTLGIRMRAHEASARAVAEVLERSSKVRATYYPGLASHPQHRIARRQMSGFGGMVSFELANAGAAGRFARALRIFTLAESLGGVESLADHPASMTHASVPPEIRRARGVRDGLIRLSCGIEDPADLADDVGRALRRV
ncbi:MAG: PLP-dependent aspartate aminotransferase family protein [Thermoplasmatales archaeon]|nr:PLP-dependent aspartate aminotransferase family protein [Thermoplasmatales archaeon]